MFTAVSFDYENQWTEHENTTRKDCSVVFQIELRLQCLFR